MKSTGIVRRIDELGRIVLPIELRKSMSLDQKGDSVEIFIDEDKIILKKYQPACIFCGNADDVIYYKNKQYSINPDLHTYVKRMGEWREFDIREYGIHIRYKTSPYIGFDVWSEEEDVDLFCYLESKYRLLIYKMK